MKKLAILLVALLVAVGLAAALPSPGASHACSGTSYTMNCVQAAQTPAATVGALAHSITNVSTPTKQGIDFAWSCPSANFLNSLGASFGASYFSPDHSKNWTLSCVNSYHAAGKATVGVWESSANRATQGYSAGYSDAITARGQARAVGEPDNRPIDYAVDCDCAGSTLVSYFQGADAGTAKILNISLQSAITLTNAYGGYYQVKYLFDHGVVGHTNWQTYAWSSGLWLPASVAPLEQWLNGSSFDHDRAIAADYGQWPYVTAPTGPTKAQIGTWTGARDSSLRAYRARKCTKPVLTGPKSCHTFASRVVYYQGKLTTSRAEKRPRCFGKQAQLGAPLCGIERPSVVVWGRAYWSTQAVYQKIGCAGPATFGDGLRTPTCNKLRARSAYFAKRIKAELY